MTSATYSFKLFSTSIRNFSNVITSESYRPCLMLRRRTPLLIHPNRTFALNFKTRILGQNMSQESLNYNFISTPIKISSLRWCGHECIQHQECWKCGTAIEPDMEQYFCICGVVQPPLLTRSYFQIFGIEEKFELNLKHLRTKYQKLQTLLHPDRYSQKSETEKDFSIQHSVLVNKAYQTLQSPLKRGLYMLHIKDEDLEKETQVNQAFLMEIFELGELVEEARNQEDLRKVERDNRKNMDELVNNISKSFESGDAETAKENLVKLKYLTSVADQIYERLGTNNSSE